MSSSIVQQKARKARKTKNDLFGVDFMFPLQHNGRGDLARVSGPDNLQQALENLFESLEGEIIYYEDMGGGAIENIHRTCNQAVADRVAHNYEKQAMKYEARLASIKIIGTPIPAETVSEPDILELDITYTSIYYHHEHNFTYDYVLRI